MCIKILYNHKCNDRIIYFVTDKWSKTISSVLSIDRFYNKLIIVFSIEEW